MFKHVSQLFSAENFSKRSNTTSSSAYYKQDDSHNVFDFLSLVKNWPHIVGELLSANTSPVRIRQKALIVLTRHSLFTQEISFMEGPILEQIYKFHPFLQRNIVKIQFQTSPSFFYQKDEIKEKKQEQNPDNLINHRFSPLYKKLKQEAEDLFASVEVPELKSLFISIYIQNVSRQRQSPGPLPK